MLKSVQLYAENLNMPPVYICFCFGIVVLYIIKIVIFSLNQLLSAHLYLKKKIVDSGFGGDQGSWC